jgi:hypothetical protein
MVPPPVVDGEDKSKNITAIHRIKIAAFITPQYFFPKMKTVNKKFICDFSVMYALHPSIRFKFKMAKLSIYLSLGNFTTIRTVKEKSFMTSCKLGKYVYS